MSEKPEWISKVECLLTIREQQIAELKRFCEKFGLKDFRLVDGQQLDYDGILEKGKQYYIHTNAGELSIARISNKPHLRIHLMLKIAEREIHVWNGTPEGKEIPLENASKFSDESMEIAEAVAKVWQGKIKVYRSYMEDGETPYADTLTVVLPDNDYIEIAYNRLH